MKNTNRRLLMLLMSFTVAACATAFAQLTPSQDAYTNSGDPTTNYGAKTLLDVDGASQVTYIQFNLASIPSGASISQATLKLYVNAVTTAGSFNVDYVSGTWSESTITYSLAPALGTTIAASVPIATAEKNQYILINITPAVQAWLNGSEPNDGIALIANGTFNATFDSKENTSTSHPPELDVVFAAGDGTITGVNTAAGSGLAGGGTTGALSLSLLTTCTSGQILSWSGSAWACKTVKGSGTVTSVASGVGLTGGPITTGGTLSIDSTVVPLLADYNTFTTGQVITSSANIDGLDAFASGVNYSGILGASTATSETGAGVLGLSESGSGYGVYGSNVTSAGYGVYGTAGGYGVYGAATGGGLGVVGTGAYGVVGSNPTGGVGVSGGSATGTGVQGIGQIGVWGASYACCSGSGGNFYGYYAQSGSGNDGTDGVSATGGSGDPSGPSNGGSGVSAQGGSGGLGGYGVVGIGGSGTEYGGVGGSFGGADGEYGGDGVDATSGTGTAGNGYAALFIGDVTVSGAITAGTKDFRIDHPGDPANKYLVHASVESSEMMNIYTGNITTDAQGNAAVQLPEWFEVLNTDFRYQLTVIGQFAQAIVAREIQNHQFEIKTNAPNVKVSWQVTGVRQDAYAKAHPLVVEEEKEARLKGFYIHPELYGQPAEKQIEWARHPEMMKRIHMKQQRQIPPAVIPVVLPAQLPPPTLPLAMQRALKKK